MKMNVAKSCLLAATVLTAAVSIPKILWADDPSIQAEAQADAAVAKAAQFLQQIQSSQPVDGLGTVQTRGAGNPFVFIGSAATNNTSAIRKAAEAVRDAKGDDAKSAAQKKLAELLNKYYDEDMVRREKELKQIEERLAKLRELLERRRAKKQDIIELQTKVALNEADGLGFYDTERPAKAGPFAAPVRVNAATGSTIAIPAPTSGGSSASEATKP